MLLKKIAPLTFSVTLAIGAAFILPSSLTPAVYAQEAAPVYQPQVAGAPDRRVGGGTRGLVHGVNSNFTLAVLAPSHLAKSAQQNPTLYWAVVNPGKVPFEFTLVHAEADVSKPESIEPILEVEISEPSSSGIQSVNLSEHKVNLTPGVPYQWSLSVSPDPKNRSNDIVATGYIIVEKPSDAVAKKLADNKDERRIPFIYAEAGLWYDAIESLSQLIKKYPQETALRRQRAALLEQIGLQEIAAIDRKS